jgi:hypothetical protein
MQDPKDQDDTAPSEQHADEQATSDEAARERILRLLLGHPVPSQGAELLASLKRHTAGER